MSTAGRRAAWLRHDAKRKATAERQLKERALSKLRHPARYQALLALVDENEIY